MLVRFVVSNNISKFNELADISNDTLFVNLHCNNSLYTQEFITQSVTQNE